MNKLDYLIWFVMCYDGTATTPWGRELCMPFIKSSILTAPGNRSFMILHGEQLVKLDTLFRPPFVEFSFNSFDISAPGHRLRLNVSVFCCKKRNPRKDCGGVPIHSHSLLSTPPHI